MRPSAALTVVVIAIGMLIAAPADARQCGKTIRVYTDPETGVVKARPDPAPSATSHCKPGQTVVWRTREGDLEIAFTDSQNPERFPQPNCRGYGVCVARVHRAKHAAPRRYHYNATIHCRDKDCVRSSDPELVVAGGTFSTDKKKWLMPPERRGGGEKENERVVIMLRVTGNTVTADPDPAYVYPGDIVEWRATRGAVRFIKFLDPNSTEYPKKARNDQRVAPPTCTAGKCTMTVSALTPWATYVYVATVRHDGKDKVADPELVVAGGEPAPPPPGRPPVPPTPPRR